MQALTSKQELFAVTFVETNNASAAYRLAYDASKSTRKSIEQNASKLLRHIKIAPRIQALQALVAKETVLDLGFVVDSFREIYERSMQHEAVLNRDGTPTGEYQFNAAGANKAMENIGRLLGFYVDRSQHMTGTPQEYAEVQALKAKYEAMSLDELLALRESRRALPEPTTDSDAPITDIGV